MKKFVIIGGGISGLAVLHFLKQKFADSAEITLFERQWTVGGTINSGKAGDCLFESGPNGFLENTETLAFIRELGLEDQIIEADAQAKRRYIQFNGQLHKAPMGPIAFLQTPLLSPGAKVRLIAGLFKKNIRTDQSIYNYVSQRFGAMAAERLADPFVNGIYAGDTKRLHMASTFPKFFSAKKDKTKTRMYSFKEGMGQVVETLCHKYGPYHIETGKEITSIKSIEADHVICATPAYVAASLVTEVNSYLGTLLNQIPYAPVSVAGLVFNQDAFEQKPDGFGYLIPSSQQKDVLGVLIESNVFPNRSPQGQVIVRVMLGGAHHPAIINDSEQQILDKALKELESSYGLKERPLQTVVKIWPKAIPQYELAYPVFRQGIADELAKTPHLHFCANYLDGISFNDCIHNARQLVDKLS